MLHNMLNFLTLKNFKNVILFIHELFLIITGGYN